MTEMSIWVNKWMKISIHLLINLFIDVVNSIKLSPTQNLFSKAKETGTRQEIINDSVWCEFL